MLPLAVELSHLPEESCVTIHLGMLHYLCGWATTPFLGNSWITSKEHSAPSSSKDIIINEDFSTIKTIELSIEKYSQIWVYMTCRSIIYSEQQLFLL